MKKIIIVLCVLFLAMNLVACSKGYDEIPEKYVNYVYKLEGDFFNEYASDLFKLLYCGSVDNFESFIESGRGSLEEQIATYNKFGKTFEYKSYEVTKEYSSDEVKEHNAYYEKADVEKFSDLVQITVYYDEFKDGEFVEEHKKSMLLGKYKGDWLLIRYFG